MKVYIPFNMIVDTDVGVIRIVEKITDLQEYPINKLKSFLLKRNSENPIQDYCKLRKVNLPVNTYDMIITEKYKTVLNLSYWTDILAFVINTYKLGLSNDMEITVGCDNDLEIEFFKKNLSSLKYSIDIRLNQNINLNDYEYIFTKYLDEFYVDYLIHNKINGKRLYVADYAFNTIVDEETGNFTVDPILHLRLESEGVIVNLLSVYNKKK